jgi:hypothetical protein
VGGDTQLLEREDDAAGAEQVDLDRGVEGRVEGHGGRRVRHDVAAREDGAPGLVEAQPVPADVARDDGHPLVEQGVDGGTADVGPQRVEGVVAEDLPPGPLGGR